MHIPPVTLRLAARYAIYGLLALNVVWYFRAEFGASDELLSDAAGWTTLITVFSETLDTLAWVALVLLFELEITILPPSQLRSCVTRLLSALRTVCYVAIIFSVYGYWNMWHTVTSVDAIAATDACAFADQGYSYLAGLDDYPALTGANCHLLGDGPLALITGTQIVGNPAQFQSARIAALVDLVNAITWLIVVVIMEAEIYLQLLGGFRERWSGFSKWVLAPLYIVLLGCAIYWLLYSDFLDFWDALLWLVAFAFIELNILDWQTGQNQATAAK